MKTVTCGVYFLFDGDELVYIGQSNNLYLRIGQHIKDGEKKFDRFEIYPTLDYKRLEGFLISTLKPKYNKAEGYSGWLGVLEDCFPSQTLKEAIEIYESKHTGYTADELSDILGLCKVCILVGIDKHPEIPSYKVGGKWYVDKKWVEENLNRLYEYF